ncbi:rCG26641 [Rattus norvegicus]|uniref:RCG26641 n=1 Tax=Rattus norvegicus TaxID=10116 RepID=A6HML4_RAT|nr:rCG26641 [Rattus norvegicus]
MVFAMDSWFSMRITDSFISPRLPDPRMSVQPIFPCV